MEHKSPGSCTFLTGGDVAPDREKGKGMFGDISPLFQASDLSFLNLEHALARSGRLMKGKPYFHRGVPEMVEGLLEAQFHVLTLANNHVLDFGEEALFETLSLLDARSIPHTGAGKDLADASKATILERDGLQIGLLAYSTTLPQGHAAGPNEPGVNPLRVKTAYEAVSGGDEYPGKAPEIVTWAVHEDLQRMKDDILRLKRRVDVILVYQHWGTSMIHQVHDFQREIGHAAIDAGADAVFGGHQHVLSAVEFYRSKPIVHCSGNLIFDIQEPFFTDATLQTFLVGGTLTRAGISDLYIIPCRCGVKMPSARLSPRRGEGLNIIRMMERLCAPFGTRLETKDGRVLLIPPEEQKGARDIHRQGPCSPEAR